MAKATGPLMSMSASGQFGKTIVFQKNGRVREYVKPANPQTTGQMAVRNLLKDIQAELKLLGSTLRTELKSNFGATWNADIIGELMSSGNAAYDAAVAEFTAFTTQQKTDWATADTVTPVVATDGALLYAVATAIYDRAARLGVTISLTLPAAGNSSTVGSEWTASS